MKTPTTEGVNQIVKSKDQTVIVGYDLNGRIQAKYDENKAAAIVLTESKKKSKYYKIKVNDANKLFNPLNKDPGRGVDSVDKIKKTQVYKLRDVNKKCFDLYLDFLTRKEESVLLVVERML